MAFDSRWKNPTGASLQQLYQWAQDIVRELRKGAYQSGIESSISDLETTVAGMATGKAAVGQVASGHWLIPDPEDKTYTVIQKSAVAFTITEVTTITAVGTATVTVKINGTSLGGSANSASTSEQSQSHSSSNAVAVGDTLAIVVSSTSSCERLTVDIAGTMDLAA